MIERVSEHLVLKPFFICTLFAHINAAFCISLIMRFVIGLFGARTRTSAPAWRKYMVARKRKT